MGNLVKPKEHGQQSILTDFLLLTFGALLLVAGTHFFKFPNHFSYGGVSGLAVVLEAFVPWTAGTITMAFNFFFLIHIYLHIKYNTIVGINDEISINTNNTYDLDVIYEDKDIIVINKPCGLLTDKTDKETVNTAYNLVKEYFFFLLLLLLFSFSRLVLFIELINIHQAY